MRLLASLFLFAAALTVLAPRPASAQSWLDKIPDQAADMGCHKPDPAIGLAGSLLPGLQGVKAIYPLNDFLCTSEGHTAKCKAALAEINMNPMIMDCQTIALKPKALAGQHCPIVDTKTGNPVTGNPDKYVFAPVTHYDVSLSFRVCDSAELWATCVFYLSNGSGSKNVVRTLRMRGYLVDIYYKASGTVCAYDPVKDANIKAASLGEQFAAGLSAWSAKWYAMAPSRCDIGVTAAAGDPSCVEAVRAIGDKAVAALIAAHNKQISVPFATLSPPYVEDAEQAAYRVMSDFEFKHLPGFWAEQFMERWQGQCPDAKCVTGLKIIRQGTLAELARVHAKPGPWALVAMPVLSRGEAQAKTLIDDAEKAAARANSQAMLAASDGWAEGRKQFWNPKCFDAACRDEIAALASKGRMAMRLAQIGSTAPPETFVAAVDKEYAPKFGDVIADSNLRRLASAKPIGAGPSPPPGPIRLPRRPQ